MAASCAAVPPHHSAATVANGSLCCGSSSCTRRAPAYSTARVPFGRSCAWRQAKVGRRKLSTCSQASVQADAPGWRTCAEQGTCGERRGSLQHSL